MKVEHVGRPGGVEQLQYVNGLDGWEHVRPTSAILATIVAYGLSYWLMERTQSQSITTGVLAGALSVAFEWLQKSTPKPIKVPTTVDPSLT